MTRGGYVAPQTRRFVSTGRDWVSPKWLIDDAQPAVAKPSTHPARVTLCHLIDIFDIQSSHNASCTLNLLLTLDLPSRTPCLDSARTSHAGGTYEKKPPQ